MSRFQYQGLEIVFAVPLHIVPSGLSPGGAIFPAEVVKLRTGEKSLVLKDDYDVLQSLVDGSLHFQSPAPNRPIMVVDETLVVKITDVATGRSLFSIHRRT